MLQGIPCYKSIIQSIQLWIHVLVVVLVVVIKLVCNAFTEVNNGFTEIFMSKIIPHFKITKLKKRNGKESSLQITRTILKKRNAKES